MTRSRECRSSARCQRLKPTLPPRRTHLRLPLRWWRKSGHGAPGRSTRRRKVQGACASEVAAREQSEELAPFGRNSGKLAALSARAISEDRGPRDTLCGARQVRRLPLARPCPACGLTLSRSTLPLTSLCADCLRAVQPKVLSVPAVRHPLWPDEADRDEAPRMKWRRSEASPGTGGGGCYDTLRHAPPFHLIADERRMAFPLPSSFTVSQGRPESFGENRRKRIRQSTVGQTREVMVEEDEAALSDKTEPP